MRTFLITVIAVLVAGCAAGPDYRRPDKAAINTSRANVAFLGAAGSPFSTTGAAVNWWQLYRDPALDNLIKQAVAANTDLRVAVANIARAQAGYELAGADRYPTTSIQASPGYGRRSAEEELIPTHGEALPAKLVYGAGIGISYQVDLFGQVSRAVESNGANVEAARAAYAATRISVIAETTRAYLDACSAEREIRVAEHSVELQTSSTDLTQRLERGGRATSLDVTRSSAQEDQVRATLPVLRAQKRLALFRLAALLARAPRDLPQSAEACAVEPRLTRPIPVGDGAALLKRRPDVRRAEAELHAATARIGVATADLYPKIVLGASAGSVGLDENLFHADTFKFSLGPLISWEFPNRSRAHARIHAAEADVDAAYARFDGTVLSALRETESALVIYARDLDRRAILNSVRQKSAQAANDTERLFSMGRIGSLPVLDANRTLVSAEQSVAAIDSKIASDQVTLFLALGGGWEGFAP